jgi:chromosomal replication initiation ATPase DnaA
MSTPYQIIADVAYQHDVTVREILSVRRDRHIAAARVDVISAVHRARPEWSQRRIGCLFKRDHKWIGKALRKTGDIA